MPTADSKTESPPINVDELLPSRLKPVDGEKPKVLLIDDEADLLSAMARQLRTDFQCTTAGNGEEGIEKLTAEGPFEVVVSDMRMPGIDGVAVLHHCAQHEPEVVRVLLTGYADIESAAAAVNEGNIFRFLTKPVASSLMRKVLRDCVKQHRQIVAERELLEGTLRGSVSALLDVLSIANPTAFTRAVRIRKIAAELLDQLDDVDRWEVEVATMLSQIGAVTLPEETVHKLHLGSPLSDIEVERVSQLPALADRFLKDIPRLENIRTIIRAQERWTEADAPVGTKVLRLAVDLDVLESRGLGLDLIMRRLRVREREYGPVAMGALNAMRAARGVRVNEIVTVDVTALAPEMVLAADINTTGGTLVAPKGTTLTQAQLDRIRNSAESAELESTTTSIVRSRT